MKITANIKEYEALLDERIKAAKRAGVIAFSDQESQFPSEPSGCSLSYASSTPGMAPMTPIVRWQFGIRLDNNSRPHAPTDVDVHFDREIEV